MATSIVIDRASCICTLTQADIVVPRDHGTYDSPKRKVHLARLEAQTMRRNEWFCHSNIVLYLTESGLTEKWKRE